MNDTRCKTCFKQIFKNVCSLFIWNKFMIENLKFMALQSQYKKNKTDIYRLWILSNTFTLYKIKTIFNWFNFLKTLYK